MTRARTVVTGLVVMGVMGLAGCGFTSDECATEYGEGWATTDGDVTENVCVLDLGGEGNQLYAPYPN